MSPSSPGVPGGEPEPAHPHQQRLGAVSDPVVPAIPSRPPHGAAGAVHHPVPLAWPDAWQERAGGAGTAGLRPRICCTLGLIPIPLPQPRRVGWFGCGRVCQWGRAWSPTPGCVRGDRVRPWGPCPGTPRAQGDGVLGAQGPARSPSSQCRHRCQHSFLVVHFPNSLAGPRLQTAYF